jgi:hypothetical protein
VTVRVVAILERQPSLEGLAIRYVRLGLDAGAPPGRQRTADVRIPSSEIALDRQGHLRAPAKAWMESGPESLKQRQLRPIPDGIARRIGADAQVQPNDSAPGTEFRNGYAIEIAVFESCDLLMRRTRSRGDVSKAQSRPDPRKSMVLTHASERISGSSSAAIVRSFSRSHALDDQQWPFAGAQPLLGPPAGPTGRRDPESGSIRAARPRLGPPAGPTGRRDSESRSIRPARPLLGPPAGPTGADTP